MGLAFAGNLKSFSEHFPEPDDPDAPPQYAPSLDAENAKILGALFRLKRRGVEMTIEKVSLH